MNAIMVCVNYSDFLALTLPWNRKHFDDVVVVTSLTDTKTVDIAWANKCRVHRTNVFYENGAIFAKYRALEEGLDILGRRGWICIMDADICWPKCLEVADSREDDSLITCYAPTSRDINTLILKKGNLYSPRRHMLDDTSSILQRGIPNESEWVNYPIHPQNREWAGYTQIFHAEDRVLGNSPWHQVEWTHCGGGDSFFQAKWSESNKIRTPWNVLHLGSAGQNWGGRATDMLDGTKVEGGDEKTRKVRELIRLRGTHPSGDRFGWEKLH